MITVIDPGAARALLLAGQLDCPEAGCTGTLRVWSKARPRPVRGLDGCIQLVRPDRGRCRACAVTQVLLPAFCLPRRGYRVEVVGAALLAAADGAGYARAAAACDVPTSTVRDWLRAVRRDAAHLVAHAVQLLHSSSDASHAFPDPQRPYLPTTGALHALGAAAQSMADWPAPSESPATPTGHGTGIDYLALLAGRHRRDVLRRLRLADPSQLPRTTAWELVTVVTAGRLLSGVAC